MNNLEKPSYSSTKKVKKFEIATCINGDTQTVYDEGSVSGSADRYYGKDVDCVNNRILSVSMYSRGIYDIKVYPGNIQVHYRSTTSSVNATLKYCSMVDDIEETTVSTTGSICDIESPLGRPSDTDKIVNYFNNRDLYTFYLRGNPARDVGDYVNVSLTNDDDTSTYKKGLVLSSILSYNGSFKEECTVRIIENDFE